MEIIETIIVFSFADFLASAKAAWSFLGIIATGIAGFYTWSRKQRQLNYEEFERILKLAESNKAKVVSYVNQRIIDAETIGNQTIEISDLKMMLNEMKERCPDCYNEVIKLHPKYQKI